MFVALLATSASATGWNHHQLRWHSWHGRTFDKLPTYLMAEPDATAQDGASGDLWVGSGIPATNMILRTNPFSDTELAIKAHLRFGSDILPTYVDSDGFVHVEVPSGHQEVPFVAPNRAKWNFTYSYNVALDPSNPTLDWYDGWLLIDSDPSADTDYTTLKLSRLPTTPSGQESDFGWKLGNTVVIGDDEGNSYVTQNSQNYGFGYSPAYAAADFPEGQFDVVMILAKKYGPRVNYLHVVFDVVNP